MPRNRRRFHLRSAQVTWSLTWSFTQSQLTKMLALEYFPRVCVKSSCFRRKETSAKTKESGLSAHWHWIVLSPGFLTVRHLFLLSALTPFCCLQSSLLFQAYFREFYIETHASKFRGQCLAISCLKDASNVRTEAFTCMSLMHGSPEFAIKEIKKTSCSCIVE